MVPNDNSEYSNGQSCDDQIEEADGGGRAEVGGGKDESQRAPANHQRHGREWEGKKRWFYAMPYDRHYIWGATAGMIRNFYDRVYAPGALHGTNLERND